MADCEPFPGDLGLTAKFLFTDASCIRLGAGPGFVASWAAMLITGERSTMCSGLLRKTSQNSTEMEIAAIAHAINNFAVSGDIATGERLVIFTDNSGAVDHLTEKVRIKRKNLPLRAVKDEVQNLLSRTQVLASFVWVRSHQGHETQDWRGLINARVDREARRITRLEARRAALVPDPIPSGTGAGHRQPGVDGHTADRWHASDEGRIAALFDGGNNGG